jgi:hypothetical protein
MPSNAQIKKQVQAAIAKTGDIAELVTYVSVTPGSYDPSTDSSDGVATQYANVKCILANLNETESDWFLPDAVTQKMIVAALDLPVTPQRADYVMISGSRWEVKRVRTVPGKSVWLLYLQEP